VHAAQFLHFVADPIAVETKRAESVAAEGVRRHVTDVMQRPPVRRGRSRPRARVLVVEDDEVIRQLVSLALEEEGYEVLQAPHGQVALQLVEQAPPDVVLLDMRMPVMDGWEFARRYRQFAQPRGHVVVMTAAVDALERAGQIDVDTVLPKPFDLNDLLSCVAQYAQPGRGSNQWM
jgi:CheY-like chemotaxis protein